MNLQQLIPLSEIYPREEDFSDDLADNLEALNVGSFEDVETESTVGTRRADIVAVGEDGILVVENQFGKADWDHWGRLEAYARLKEAAVAVLVAEDFEELMITTCNLRNEDSEIDWYLIQVEVNSHEELSFHPIVQPAIDIQVERNAGVEYSEFWEPIRREGLFSGKPVPVRAEGWIGKSIRGISVNLVARKKRCSVNLWFQGENRAARREETMELFPESQYNYEFTDRRKSAGVVFPVLDKGQGNREDWDEVREKLVAMGTDIYNKIYESDV